MSVKNQKSLKLFGAQVYFQTVSYKGEPEGQVNIYVSNTNARRDDQVAYITCFLGQPTDIQNGGITGNVCWRLKGKQKVRYGWKTWAIWTRLEEAGLLPKKDQNKALLSPKNRR